MDSNHINKVLLVAALTLLVAAMASATPTYQVNFVDGTYAPGELANIATFALGDPSENQITAEGFYYDEVNDLWTSTNLYLRDQNNDHGLGVCSPGDRNSSGDCPGPSGGGDWNEVDNAGDAEIIRLSLPDGFTWTSVGLSSLDGNSNTVPERGQLWADDDGDLSNGFGFLLTQFMFDGLIEPDIDISSHNSTKYLIFQPFDWSFTTSSFQSTSTASDNNDFLVRAAVVTEQEAPEPSTLLMLVAGAGFVAASRRRRC